MTTAHRPTWAPALGGDNQGGNKILPNMQQKATRDHNQHMTLKYRQEGQNHKDALFGKDLKSELEEREKKVKMQKEKEQKLAIQEENPFPEDADDEPDAKVSDSEDDDSDDDAEDEEELMRELAKIKAEREAEEERKRQEEAKIEAKAAKKEALTSNPLINLQSADMSLKRAWDDDTVFKNQAKDAPKVQRRYINDAVRSDFHKKFLSKYMV